ncbi:MAG: GNAT family N-acetyltransferase [Planctomycetota bacterium]|nr:GNAT family N-acetyltransferase [Planctomycetota bacterium]
MNAPAVSFRPLTATEYDVYIDATTTMYAGEIAIAAELTGEEALALARKQIGGILTEGLATPGHDFLRVVDAEGEDAGTLWLGPRKEDPLPEPTLYIYDIVVDPDRRGQGLGTAVLAWVEEEARRRDLLGISLSVVAHNEGAIRLYTRLGYEPLQQGKGGMSMCKRLRPERGQEADPGA